MLDVSNFWDLIEQRAQQSPNARMAVDETRREMTFAQYRADAERAAAGLLAMGIGKGSVVSWQLPTWLESFVLCAALSRLEAIQNPILPRAKRGRSCSSCRASGATSTSRAWRAGSRERRMVSMCW
jgi:cyclohexanecarboxylate-CoA ligase